MSHYPKQVEITRDEKVKKILDLKRPSCFLEYLFTPNLSRSVKAQTSEARVAQPAVPVTSGYSLAIGQSSSNQADTSKSSSDLKLSRAVFDDLRSQFCTSLFTRLLRYREGFGCLQCCPQTPPAPTPASPIALSPSLSQLRRD